MFWSLHFVSDPNSVLQLNFLILVTDYYWCFSNTGSIYTGNSAGYGKVQWTTHCVRTIKSNQPSWVYCRTSIPEHWSMWFQNKCLLNFAQFCSILLNLNCVYSHSRVEWFSVLVRLSHQLLTMAKPSLQDKATMLTSSLVNALLIIFLSAQNDFDWNFVLIFSFRNFL